MASQSKPYLYSRWNSEIGCTASKILPPNADKCPCRISGRWPVVWLRSRWCWTDRDRRLRRLRTAWLRPIWSRCSAGRCTGRRAPGIRFRRTFASISTTESTTIRISNYPLCLYQFGRLTKRKIGVNWRFLGQFTFAEDSCRRVGRFRFPAVGFVMAGRSVPQFRSISVTGAVAHFPIIGGSWRLVLALL